MYIYRSVFNAFVYNMVYSKFLKIFTVKPQSSDEFINLFFSKDERFKLKVCGKSITLVIMNGDENVTLTFKCNYMYAGGEYGKLFGNRDYTRKDCVDWVSYSIISDQNIDYCIQEILKLKY